MRPIRFVVVVCGFAVLLVVLSVAHADAPAGLAPRLGIGRAVDAQSVEIQTALERLVREQVAAPQVPGPNVQNRAPATVARPVVEQVLQRVQIAQLTAQHADGSAVSGDDLVKALAKPTPVVLGKSGQKIDPVYLSVFRPDTLVLLVPEQAMPVVGAPNPNARNPALIGQPTSPLNPQPAATTPTTPATPAAPSAPAVPAAPAVPRKFGS